MGSVDVASAEDDDEVTATNFRRCPFQNGGKDRCRAPFDDESKIGFCVADRVRDGSFVDDDDSGDDLASAFERSFGDSTFERFGERRLCRHEILDGFIFFERHRERRGRFALCAPDVGLWKRARSSGCETSATKRHEHVIWLFFQAIRDLETERCTVAGDDVEVVVRRKNSAPLSSAIRFASPSASS